MKFRKLALLVGFLPVLLSIVAAPAFGVQATTFVAADTVLVNTIAPTADGLAILGAANFAAMRTAMGVATSDPTFITKTASSALSNEFAMGSLATGIVMNTTTTGVPSIAIAGTDYVSPNSDLINDATFTVFTGSDAALLGTNSDGGALVTFTGGGPIGLAGGSVTFDASNVLTGTLTVEHGGTGAATLTGLLKGNGTSAFTVASAGTDYLTPSGSGAALTGIRTQTPVVWLGSNLSQNTTYYVGQVLASPSTTAGVRRIRIATACTLTKGYGWWTSTNASSNENNTLVIRKNNTSDTTFATAAIGASNTPVEFSNAAIGLSLAAGEYIEVKVTTAATFATAPNAVYGGITLEFSY